MMKKNDVPFVITVRTSYIAEQSNPVLQKFTWSYEITIENNSPDIVQLVHRYWRIVDMAGRVEEVNGVGVIGLQPLIKPNKSFVYTSFCQLATPQGTMEGRYAMENLEEERFMVEIPKFILSAPSAITKTFKSILH
jgi:ApaG protein